MKTTFFTDDAGAIISEKLNCLSIKNEYIVNEEMDNERLTNTTVTRTIFTNVSLKQAEVEHCNFSYSIFINCYFRGTKFSSCDFTGCKFIECNFRAATLISCQLRYSSWNRTYVDQSTLLANVPSYHNQAQELLISLRTNATSIGQYEDSRKYFYEAEKHSRGHRYDIVLGLTPYYRDKYSVSQRVGAIYSLVKSTIDRFFWGYGEQPGRLLCSGALGVIVFALVYMQTMSIGFWGALKISLSALAGNHSQENNWWLISESLLGLIYIAFLAASLHRRIATRRDR